MPSAELTEWMAYYLIEPFGQSRTDDGAKMLASLIYNSNRGPTAKALSPADFLKAWQPQEVIDEAANIERLAAWFEARAVPG